MNVQVQIYGQTFSVNEYDWYTYLAEASSQGKTEWFASKDIDECRHFIETVIAKDGGMAKIEMWDLTEKANPNLSRSITTIISPPNVGLSTMRPTMPPDGA